MSEDSKQPSEQLGELADPGADPLSWSRRVFIHRLTFLGGGVVLFGACSKHDAEAPHPRSRAEAAQVHALTGLTSSHRTFTDDEYAALVAAADRILPRDEDPGAVDANVPEYIDRMLTSPELHRMREDFINGLNALDRRARRTVNKPFAQASAQERDQLLTEFKNFRPGSGEEHFYELLVTLTLEGFLGDPSYGGNKDHVGWALVGFGTSEPPPGYDGMKHLHLHLAPAEQSGGQR